MMKDILKKMKVHYDTFYNKVINVVGDLCQEWPEGSIFNSYFTEV